MASIRLIRLERETEQAIESDLRYFAALVNEDWGQVADVVYGVVGKKVDPLPAMDPELHWGGYLVVDVDTRTVVGSCAFKSGPTDEGVVEIAYFTYPGHERRGYATAMAVKLMALASSSPDVSAIVAHTLPQRSASTRVLEKAGMHLVGEAHDPDDGLVCALAVSGLDDDERNPIRWRGLGERIPRR